MAKELAPVNPPIDIFGHVSSGETLVLKEKLASFTGDSFDIKDITGAPFLKVKGKMASISGRKEVYFGDQHLCDIKKEHMHIHSTYVVITPAEDKVLEIKSSFKLVGSKATATLFPGTEKEVVFEMKGGWFDSSADITWNGTPVARIDRKLLKAREIIGGQQTYALICAPGVDKVLMAAMCIAFDEKNNERPS